MKELNIEQQNLVSENHSLIYGFANKKGIDVCELYDILAIGLCNAALTYKGEKSKFSTYAYKCMHSEYVRNIRESNREKVVPLNKLVSFDSHRTIESGGGKNYDVPAFSEMLFNNYYNTDDRVLTKYIYAELQSALNNKEVFVLDALIEGFSQKEIAKMLNCTVQNVSLIIKKIRRIYNTYYKEKEIDK